MSNEQTGAEQKKSKVFWRVQRECWRRMVTPYLMYLFMSLVMLALQAIENDVSDVITGIVCILIGAAFNAHLCYHYGILHFDVYLTGELHRRNAVFGISSGGDHRVEREYRPWKGFYIGFLIGVPVIILGTIAATTGAMGSSIASVALVMFAGWAILPISWLRNLAGLSLNFGWSIVMIVLPILVSGIFYIVGAQAEKRKKEALAQREEEIAEAGRKARKK